MPSSTKILTIKWHFPFYCCLLVLAKFALISSNEIVSQQHDSFTYAAQSVGSWTLGAAPQGYPVWLSLCRAFGVPQRLCIEAFYLAAALFVAYSARKLLGILAAYAIFGLLAFAPFTFFLFDLGLSDGFYSCLTLISLGISIQLLISTRLSAILGWAVSLGGVFGWMSITRNEDPLLACWTLLLIGALAVTRRREAAVIFSWKSWRAPILTGFVTAMTTFLIISGICLSFYLTDGVFARGIATMPGHTMLLKNLSQIETGQPQIRFVPISRRSRELAYRVSPSLAKYRSLIENPDDMWQVVSRSVGIPDGEIGGGWIWHAINSKVLFVSRGRPALAEAAYRKINAELKTAFADGRLKRRFILHSLIGGNITGLLRDLPPSISAVASAAFSSQPNDTKDQGFETTLFDRAFVRRSALIPQSPEMAVQGWAFVNKPGQKIVEVVVASDLVNSAPVLPQGRPDVVQSFNTQNGWKPEVVGFHASLKSRSPDEIRLTYVLDDGTRVGGGHLKAMQISKLENRSAPGSDVMQGIDLVGSSIKEDVYARHGMELGLVVLSQWFTLRLLAVATFALAFLITGYKAIRKQDTQCEIFVFFSFTLLLWIARILFYSLLNARAWSADQIRYLAPANALGLVMFSASVSTLAVLLRRRGASKEHTQEAENASKSHRGKFAHI